MSQTELTYLRIRDLAQRLEHFHLPYFTIVEQLTGRLPFTYRQNTFVLPWQLTVIMSN